MQPRHTALLALASSVGAAMPLDPSIDAVLLRALVPTAVAGLFGGVALALWSPSSNPWSIVRVTALGLILGAVTGAAIQDWPLRWPDLQHLHWGARIVLAFFVGFGAKWLIGAAARVFASIESNPFAYLRQVVKALLTGGASKP